jgi:RimJ/RimL family protein N-acetyltransferase
MEATALYGEILYTRRLQLRRIRESDLPLILAWSNSNEACGPYLTPEGFCARGLKEQYTANAFWNPHDKMFLIEKRAPVSAIGTIHYWIKPDQFHSAVMSVKIAAIKERGNGYGTEAQKYLIIHLFDQIGVHQVEMFTDIDNRAQQRCLKKLGFAIHRSLTYDDRQIKRTGLLLRLTEKDFRATPVYRFHYE